MLGRDDAPDVDALRIMERAGGLLPLFFVVTGLIMNIGALSGRSGSKPTAAGNARCRGRP
jgi:hypothetical protein